LRKEACNPKSPFHHPKSKEPFTNFGANAVLSAVFRFPNPANERNPKAGLHLLAEKKLFGEGEITELIEPAPTCPPFVWRKCFYSGLAKRLAA